MIAKFAIGRDLVADQLKLPQNAFRGMTPASEAGASRRDLPVDRGSMSDKAFTVLMGVLMGLVMTFCWRLRSMLS